MTCDSEYEYEPHGVFGTGSSQPLPHVEGQDKPPLGLKPAAQRASSKEPAKIRIPRPQVKR